MTPAQIQQVIEQLEREGYVLCKKDVRAWVRYEDNDSDEEDLEFTSRYDPNGFPLYSAAPAYTPQAAKVSEEKKEGGE